MLSDQTITILKELKSNKYDFKEVNILSLTEELIKHIGDPDPNIRDGLIYPVLAHLLHDDVHQKEELIKFTHLLLSEEYLFKGIHTKSIKNTVTRTFTLLQLVILIYKHNKDHSLTDELQIRIFNAVLEYFNNESIYLGYDDTYGFVHAVAHTADVFNQMAKSPLLTKVQVKEILSLIVKAFKNNTYQFICDEDERMVNAIETMIKSNYISKEELILFIDSLADFEKGDKYPEAYIITSNIKGILRSLYFRFLDQDEFSYLTEYLKEKLKLIK